MDVIDQIREMHAKGVSHGVAKLLRMGERNGVVRRGKATAEPSEGRGSAVLQMKAEKERKRAQLDIGAFLLSREEELLDD